jgi:hypothetical protein
MHSLRDCHPRYPYRASTGTPLRLPVQVRDEDEDNILEEPRWIAVLVHS